MKKNNQNFDVIIVGGGLAGLSLACSLATYPDLQIACIDQADPKSQSIDLRTTAISYGSSQILDRAGVWGDMRKAACPIENIEILDGDSPLLLNFLSSEVENRAFGWIVNNADLRAALLKKVKSLKNIQHFSPAQVSDFEVSDKSASALLADGTRLTASLIIGADGRNSFTREWMDIPTRQWSYDQRAVICCVEHENPHSNIAVEHFWPEGPFAILPMADAPQSSLHGLSVQSSKTKVDYTHKACNDGFKYRSSVVFTEHGPEKQSLMRFTDTEFETALAARFPARYGHVKMIGQRAAYPLSLVHATSYIGPRMALVADAAHGIHPIAGQGLNLGFRDVDKISALIATAYQNGEDIGAPKLLQEYQRARRLDNMSMVAVTDGLVRLFSNRLPPVRFLRRSGLKLVSHLRPAKQFFMRQAMGER